MKFEDYAAHGVAEYWIIDPTRQTVETFVIDADTEAYAASGTFRIGESVSSQLLTGFTIPVKALFNSVANMNALREILEAR